MMTTLIHVVVSCTERKSAPALPSLRASELTRDGFDLRIASWLERIGTATPTLRAADLYQGEHWAVTLDLIADSRVKVWVASAGYGLVDVQTLVAPYAATFSSRQADSVTLATSPTAVDSERREWWRTLRERSSRGSGRSMAALGADGPILVAASRSYLAAMSDELVEAEAQSFGRLVLTTTGAVPGELRHLRTAATGALRGVLGGSMQAVSVRLAAKIVQDIAESELTYETASNLTERLMAGASPLERHSRSPLTDGQVSAYIANALNTANPPSCTALLRIMRDAGLACEQARFRHLYLATRGER